MNTKSLVIVFFTFLSSVYTENITVSGRVTDASTGEILPGVNISGQNTGTSTNSEGRYTVTISEGELLEFSHIGYESESIIPVKPVLNVQLRKTIIDSDPVFVEASRAIPGVTPVAFSTLTPEEIELHYTVQDVPMILATEPGVFARGESGSGTGYTYISIRGFDQSRIAVMIDGVPLNDNESHQVYWVDHGDILADAKDIQIQRGIGNSLYGSAAFGGSINLQTKIASENEKTIFTGSLGSFDTKKISLAYNSGQRFGNISLSSRFSSIDAAGYRDFHGSNQKSFTFGAEQRISAIINQFRFQIGYENTQMVWDGIPESYLSDEKLRRSSYQGYTDNFLQQIYSLNSHWRINDTYRLTNKAYFVLGSGYYEIQIHDADWFSYNLDSHDEYTDSIETTLTTDALRRKWIKNYYTGVVPTFTVESPRIRLDIGSELRFYQGVHYGEISDFSDTTLGNRYGNKWYEYYRYIGSKLSITNFAHISFYPIRDITIMADIQVQSHDWKFDQKNIGHANGFQLDALWTFINPRIGILYHFTPELFTYLHYGKGQKEPADDQIISADDVTSAPKKASAEVINNYELGIQYDVGDFSSALNFYFIEFTNEQLKNINIDQEGEYDYYSADKTQHSGIEMESKWEFLKNLLIGINGSMLYNTFTSGELNGNQLPRIPRLLCNGYVTYRWKMFLNSVKFRYIGKQFLDDENRGTIEDALITDMVLSTKWRGLTAKLSINNMFNILYETYGYAYIDENKEYQAFYWPEATRNYSMTIRYEF